MLTDAARRRYDVTQVCRAILVGRGSHRNELKGAKSDRSLDIGREMQAASRNVVLDSLELEVEGTLVPRLGSTATPPRLKDIRYHVYIGSPESKEKIQQLQQAVEATCPIYHMLKDAQPINGSIVRGPYR